MGKEQSFSTDPEKATRENYTATAPDYVTDPLEYPEVLKRMRELEPHANLRILVIGCGPAEDVLELQKIGFNDIVAIDSSPGMIEVAREKTRETDSIQIIQMEMNDLGKNFKEEEFDIVFSQYALFHELKSKLPGTISAISKVLKPNGFLYITTQESLAGIPYESTSQRGDDQHWVYVNAETNETLTELFDTVGIDIFFVGTRLPEPEEHQYFKLTLAGQKRSLSE